MIPGEDRNQAAFDNFSLPNNNFASFALGSRENVFQIFHVHEFVGLGGSGTEEMPMSPLDAIRLGAAGFGCVEQVDVRAPLSAAQISR